MNGYFNDPEATAAAIRDGWFHTGDAAVGHLGSIGEYGWGGAANTGVWIDPKEAMVCLLMIQFMPPGHYPIDRQFKALAYQALSI